MKTLILVLCDDRTEPERTAATAYLGPLSAHNQSFPNFTIHSNPPAGSLLLDLGNPRALEYMTRYLSEAVKSFKLDVLRMDFNIAPAASWALKDAQQAAAAGTAVQSGLAEVAYIEGLYKMWSTVIAENPAVLLDNCASGGRRIDLETATLSVPLWQSDLAGNRGDTSESWQSQSMGLSCFLPIHSGGCPRFDSHTTSGSTGEAGLTLSVEPYVWRSCGSVGKAIAWTPEMWQSLAENSTLAAGVRRAVAETQRMRELVSIVDAEFWPLTPIDPAAPWAAYQHVTSNGSSGFAVVFHRPNSQSNLVRLVTNRSDYKWVTVSSEGYYRGKYYFTPASNAAAALPACQQACTVDGPCEGFTFVQNGGPPCALYSSIDGPFAAGSRVTQVAKLYECGLSSCVFGVDSSGIRHAVQTHSQHPFLAACGPAAGVFAPNCKGVGCGALMKAADGPAVCPPYAVSAEFSLELRSLQEASSYDVSLMHDSYEETGSRVMKGSELRNMSVTLPSRSVLLVWFTARAKSARAKLKTDELERHPGAGAGAGLSLGPLLTGGMVFPSGNGTVRGAGAAPSALVVVNFTRAGKATIVRGSSDARGSWAVHLQLSPSLTPGDIMVTSSKDSVVLRDVLVGSLILCAGQRCGVPAQFSNTTCRACCPPAQVKSLTLVNMLCAAIWSRPLR